MALKLPHTLIGCRAGGSRAERGRRFNAKFKSGLKMVFLGALAAPIDKHMLSDHTRTPRHAHLLMTVWRRRQAQAKAWGEAR